MKYKLLILIISFINLLVLIYLSKNEKSPIVFPDGPSTPLKPPEKPPLEEIPEIPNFIEYLPIRKVDNLGKVLSDIESHLPAGHIYTSNDKITWAHESIHGINSDLRMKFSRILVSTNYGTWHQTPSGSMIFKSSVGINGFYTLDNKACIIKEPNTTIYKVANLVPVSLQGDVYQTYLIHQAKHWNNTPLYIFDEWTAYTTGSIARLDLNIKNRSETVLFALEFNVYALSVIYSLYLENQHIDEQLKKYTKWNCERTMQIYEESKKYFGENREQEIYLYKMRNSSDAKLWRTFIKNYFGEKWSKDILTMR